MPRFRRLVLWSLFTLVGCADVVPDQEPLPWDQDRALLRLVPEVGTLELAAGGTADLSLLAYYDDALEPVSVTAAASWRSSDPAVAEVSATGTVEGMATGTAALYATLGGVTSDPVTVLVGRSAYTVTVEGHIGRRGKLLDLVVTSPDGDFAVADSVELSVPGLVPFGEDRPTEPWWGVVPGTTNAYRAVFLIPPTAPLGQLPINLRVDGSPPQSAPQVEIQRNESLEGAPEGCPYFNEDDTSNWTFTADGTNRARTWLLGGLPSGTLLRLSARSQTAGDVDPWMAVWSLDGELLMTNDTAVGSAGTDEAALEVTARQTDFDGAFFLTASVSPTAIGSQTGGTLGTNCLSRALPSASAEALAPFPIGGIALTPGRTVQEFDLSAFAGSVARAYVYLDLDLEQLGQTTVRLRAPDGSEVDLIDDAWGAAVDVPSGSRWLGTLGAPNPFLPTADAVGGGAGTPELSGVLISGTWEVEVDVQTVGELGAWYDAAVWVEAL